MGKSSFARTRKQKGVAVVLIFLLVGFLTLFLLSWLMPGRPGETSSSAFDSPGIVILGIMEAVFLAGFVLYAGRVAFCYHLRADAEGVSQTNGFTTQAVLWRDVVHFRVCLIKNTRVLAPICYNAYWRVIFHPAQTNMMRIGGTQPFWDKVAAHLREIGANEAQGYVAPPPLTAEQKRTEHSF